MQWDVHLSDGSWITVRADDERDARIEAECSGIEWDQIEYIEPAWPDAESERLH